MENQENKKTSTLTIVNGGVEQPVRFQDGREELVKIRQLPLRHMGAFGAAQGDEPKMCELVTSKDAEWFDSLTTESQEKIVQISEELNMDFFLRWAERRMAANKKLQPLVPASNSAKSASPS